MNKDRKTSHIQNYLHTNISNITIWSLTKLNIHIYEYAYTHAHAYYISTSFHLHILYY